MNHPSATPTGRLLAIGTTERWAALMKQLATVHELLHAPGLAEAARAVEQQCPDLALVDAAAVEDAASLAAALPDLQSGGMPVLVLGDLSAELLARATALGIDDWLPGATPPELALRRIQHHLELRRATALLAARGMSDSLTGLASRQRFEEFLHATFGHAVRCQEPIALILFDIDHFDAYNRALGAQAGDEVLLHIGRALASARRRPLDLFGRLSGDCFACVLPATDREGARTVAELLLADVDALEIDHPASDVSEHVTVSVGVAACRPQTGDHPLSLLEQASQALRRAKQAGRHTVSD